jgi:hypothetical protein
MRILIWIANHALWISLVGALCSVAVRFERLLPRRLHKLALFISLFVTFATPLLGMLKKSLDDHWKTQMQEQVDAALKASQPKPLKERLKACLDSVDTRILQALAQGQTRFHGDFKPYQFAELQKIAAEPGADAYISFHAESALTFGADGTYNPASFELKPDLLR